jgi:hypothetical protein
MSARLIKCTHTATIHELQAPITDELSTGALIILILILHSPGKFFKIKFFFSLPGEVFLIKKKKKSFYEKFAGRQQ